MSQHTQGKWAKNPQWPEFIIDQHGRTICQVAAYHYGFAVRDANCARIVACVNACEGYPTPDLEDVARLGGLPAVKAGIEAQLRWLKDVTAQRDELLAALEFSREVFHQMSMQARTKGDQQYFSELLVEGNTIDAAIARAKGAA